MFQSSDAFCSCMCPVRKGVGCSILTFSPISREDVGLGVLLVLMASEQTRVLIWSVQGEALARV